LFDCCCEQVVVDIRDDGKPISAFQNSSASMVSGKGRQEPTDDASTRYLK
jgi:hypothetical protein